MGEAKGRGGGERGACCTPGLAWASAQQLQPALRLASHGAAVPRGAAAAGAAAAGAAAGAAGASPGALPRALQLPARRRPALPRPAGRPHPTVSTRRPATGPSLAPRSGPPCFPTLWLRLPGSLEKKAAPCQTPPPFRVMRMQSLGTCLCHPVPCAPWVGTPPAGTSPASGGPRPTISPSGAAARAWNCPEATREGLLPAAAGRGQGVMLLGQQLSLSAEVESGLDLCASQVGEGYCDPG